MAMIVNCSHPQDRLVKQAKPLLGYRCENCGEILSTQRAFPNGFDEDHKVETRDGRHGSIKRSHRAEGRNWID